MAQADPPLLVADWRYPVNILRLLRQWWQNINTVPPCPAGGKHDWVEYAGLGAGGFEDGMACTKCGRHA